MKETLNFLISSTKYNLYGKVLTREKLFTDFIINITPESNLINNMLPLVDD